MGLALPGVPANMPELALEARELPWWIFFENKPLQKHRMPKTSEDFRNIVWFFHPFFTKASAPPELITGITSWNMGWHKWTLHNNMICYTVTCQNMFLIKTTLRFSHFISFNCFNFSFGFDPLSSKYLDCMQGTKKTNIREFSGGRLSRHIGP